MASQPRLDGRVLMGGVVVHHQVDLQVRRHVGVDVIEVLGVERPIEHPQLVVRDRAIRPGQQQRSGIDAAAVPRALAPVRRNRLAVDVERGAPLHLEGEITDAADLAHVEAPARQHEAAVADVADERVRVEPDRGVAPMLSPTVFNFYRPGYVPPNLDGEDFDIYDLPPRATDGPPPSSRSIP